MKTRFNCLNKKIAGKKILSLVAKTLLSSLLTILLRIMEHEVQRMGFFAVTF